MGRNFDASSILVCEHDVASHDSSNQVAVDAKKRILVVEDERDLAELIVYQLQREGLQCHWVTDGQSALTEARRQPPDLIVLDRMLPVLSGDEFIAQLRRDLRNAHIPVVMLTAKAEESDELTGFAIGADDYITKPFSMKSFLARVHALLRRSGGTVSQAGRTRIGPFALDRGRYEVTVHGARLNLTATEFRLFAALMSADGRVLSRSQLIDAALGVDVAVTDRTIDVHITALRKKISSTGDDPSLAKWLQTMRGVGYSFRQP